MGLQETQKKAWAGNGPQGQQHRVNPFFCCPSHRMRLCCSYSLHNKGFEFFNAQDQTQTVIVMLLNLAGSGIMVSRQLMAHCSQHTGMAVCRLWKDPYSAWVSGGEVWWWWGVCVCGSAWGQGLGWALGRTARVIGQAGLVRSGIMVSHLLMSRCSQHTGMAVYRLYQDPYQTWVRGSGVGAGAEEGGGAEVQEQAHVFGAAVGLCAGLGFGVQRARGCSQQGWQEWLAGTT